MATKWDRVPKFNDDVAKSSMEDARKVVKDTSKLRGAAVDAVKEAGSRAASRLLGRAGLAGASLQTGYDAGRALDEATGIGKKMVDKSGLGDLAAKAATLGERVTLTKGAQSRIDRGDLDEKPVKRSVSRTTVSAEPAPQMKEEKDYGPDIRDDVGPPKEPSADNMLKRGGRVHASKRADGIAQRGHTRYRGDKH